MRRSKSSFLIFSVVLLLNSCSKDSVTITDAEIEEGQTPDSEEPQTTNMARLTAKTLYDDLYIASIRTNSDTAWPGDEPNCDAGTIPEDVNTKIFKRLEYFRKAAGLNNQVAENSTKSDKAQKAALMMHANNTLNHFPPDSWKCFSMDGMEGAGNSLLTTATNAAAIDSYIMDNGSANGPVGHRRWLLWPRLQEIGVGNTSRANALWVLGNAGTPPADAPEFIVWPPEGYVPNRLVYNRWSFSINGADFTATQVRMKDENDKDISLSLEALNDQFGDKTIVWVPEGISKTATEDTSYTVTLENVGINGEMKTFEYEVILFDVNN